MAQIKKDTSLRKAILQAAITGQLISEAGGESRHLLLQEKLMKMRFHLRFLKIGLGVILFLLPLKERNLH